MRLFLLRRVTTKSPIAKTRFRLFLGNQSSYFFNSFFIKSRRLYQTRFEIIKPFEIFLHFQNLRKQGAKSIANKLQGDGFLKFQWNLCSLGPARVQARR